MISWLLSGVNIQTVLLGVFVFLLVSWLIQRKFDGYSFPPGPRPWPVLGNFPQIAWSGKTIHQYLSGLVEHYGDVIHLKFGQYDCVVLNSVDDIKETFFREEFSGRPDFIYFLKEFSDGAGTIMSTGETWKQMRRSTLTSLRDFGVGKKTLEQRIQEEAHHLLTEIEGYSESAFSPKPILLQAASNIICTVIFGHRYDYGDPELTGVVNRLTEFFRCTSFGDPENYLSFLRYTPFSYKKKAQKIRAINTDLRVWIKARIDEHRSSYDPDYMRDYVDLYLKASQDEDSEIFNEVNFFFTLVDLFSAGTETTATILVWMLLYLIREPEIQDKCRQEILKVVGSSRPVAYADRQNLPYVDAFIHETLRMTSIVPLGVVHTATVDAKLRDYILPAQTMVFANIYHVHRDPKHWPEPDKFMPDRWLDKDGKFVLNDAFMPFAVGKRRCIGEFASKMEMFLFLAIFLQRMEFKPRDADSIPEPVELPGGDFISTSQSFEVRAYRI